MTKKNKMSSFAAIILTHGRPNAVVTYETLRRCGYTGPIILVCDDEDKTLPEYIKTYGESVKTFSKEEIAKKFDEGDNFPGRRGAVYARNAIFDIAEQCGYEYFVQLDDDYVDFRYTFDNEYRYGPKGALIFNLDEVFSIMLEFLEDSGAHSIAFAQGGDFIGGHKGHHAKSVHLMRKCMNSWFCTIKRRIWFVSKLNDDVNTYILQGSIGRLIFTTNQIRLNQLATQANSGGMTEIFLSMGTYVKSFYSVMYFPSSVQIAMMGSVDRRLHHFVKWNNTVPKIVPESCRKAD